jgi:hypothetical protein
MIIFKSSHIDISDMPEQIFKIISQLDGMTTCRSSTTETVASILSHLQLSNRYFVVLVDGKRASLGDQVTPQNEVTILTKIAGGSR